MNDKVIYAVEYSAKCKSFKIRPLTQMIIENRNNVQQGLSSSYLLIGFGQTEQGANAIKEVLKKNYNLEEKEKEIEII